MRRLKEAMLLLIANDGPLPPEYLDHELGGDWRGFRECHIGGDFLLIYDLRVVSPRIFKFRQEYIDHADEPEVANPAKERFDRYHRESITVLMLSLGALLGLVLFSAGISTAITYW